MCRGPYCCVLLPVCCPGRQPQAASPLFTSSEDRRLACTPRRCKLRPPPSILVRMAHASVQRGVSAGTKRLAPPAPPKKPAGGGLFGTRRTAPPAPAPKGGGLFGTRRTAPPAPAGGRGGTFKVRTSAPAAASAGTRAVRQGAGPPPGPRRALPGAAPRRVPLMRRCWHVRAAEPSCMPRLSPASEAHARAPARSLHVRPAT